MKNYTIKYEDISGDCHIESYTTYDIWCVRSLLKYPVRLIYWIKSDL